MAEEKIEKFSLDDFKHWMKTNGDYITQMSKSLIGTCVESKISSKKMLSRMSLSEGDLKEVAIDFKRNGGKIIGMDGNSLLIEVSCGSFYMPKQSVRRRR